MPLDPALSSVAGRVSFNNSLSWRRVFIHARSGEVFILSDWRPRANSRPRGNSRPIGKSRLRAQSRPRAKSRPITNSRPYLKIGRHTSHRLMCWLTDARTCQTRNSVEQSSKDTFEDDAGGAESCVRQRARLGGLESRNQLTKQCFKSTRPNKAHHARKRQAHQDA